ncbi:MAG: arylsulfatase, partial [Verrucomicrobiota bacterium]
MKSLHLFLLVFLSVSASTRETHSASPNIVILYADDLGYGDLGCYNPESKIPTPHLDQLAADGMRFTDGHSSSGICTPSRYALLTGRHHWRKFHGIVNALGGSVFDADRLTLPEMLQEKGYSTACIGKWHLGWDWDAIKLPNAKANTIQDGNRKKTEWPPTAFDWSQPIPDGPLAHGFDHYFGDTVINFPPYAWIEDDKLVEAPDTLMDTTKWKLIKEGNWECRPGPMISTWDPYENIPETTRRGVAYIKTQAETDNPFFLYFAFPSPHAPIIPNDRFDGKSQAGPYGDFVHETDDAIGQLLAALEDSGQADNTIVIFTADNGPEKYAYARTENHDHWSSTPLRGLKRDIYEGGHRVPFIIKWPGLLEPGSTSDALVSQIDLMATLAAHLDFDLPDNAAEDSHNLLPLFNGDTTDPVRTTHIHNTKTDHYAIRHGDWLLVDAKNGYVSGRFPDWEEQFGYTNDDNEAGQLFNLKTDLTQ